MKCTYCEIELELFEPGIGKCPECGCEYSVTTELSEWDLYLKNCY